MKKILASVTVILAVLMTIPTSFQAKATPSGQYFDHSVYIIMENSNFGDIIGNSCCVFETNLYNANSGLSNYHDVSTPSLPNYLALISGQDWGCGGYDGSPNSNTCTSNVWNSVNSNLVDRLGSVTWKGYMEGMPSTNICSGGGSSDGGTGYIVHHNPFAYFGDIASDSTRCQQVVQAGTYAGATSCSDSTPSTVGSYLIADLNGTSPPNFAWFTPNNYDNMHQCDSPRTHGDQYLSVLVPAILTTKTFENPASRAVLILGFDENGNPPLTLVGSGVNTNYVSISNYNHYNLLDTYITNWGLTCLVNDCGTQSLGEFFTPGAFASNQWNSNNNCDGVGSGTESISYGVLHTDELNVAGDNSHYGYCDALRGYFPWDPATLQGVALPGNVVSISSSGNFLARSLLSGSRYHLYVALYYQLTNGAIQSCNIVLDNLGCKTKSWVDAQIRVENIGGTDSAIGTQDTYDPDPLSTVDSFGYDQVDAQVPVGNSYVVVNFNVEIQFERAAFVWGIPASTPHVLKGVEIGTKGFQFNEVKVDWPQLQLTTPTYAQPTSVCYADTNYDHTINVLDLTGVGLSFGTTLGQSNYVAPRDINQDRFTNIFDLVDVGRVFSGSC